MELFLGWLQLEFPLAAKLWESGVLIALETMAIWVLWNAYREKEKLLHDLLKETSALNTRKLMVLQRLEQYLASQHPSTDSSITAETESECEKKFSDSRRRRA
ncbi:MAG: hypothetical protein NW208_03535 [Bryobacter sp.]|nr:hypothetical protein [Bryobacter sp.]